MFSLAHLSDLHLGPLPPGSFRRHFALKRSIGAINWRLNRHRVHDPAVAQAIALDIQEAGPDHVACTGDIVNVAAHAEFPAAANWLRALGEPSWISFVPGNHDTYVRCDWQHGLSHLAGFMQGDMRLNDTMAGAQIATPFPFVRLRRNVALIGLSTALPQPLHSAKGKLGPVQLAALSPLLRDLRERGYARVVMLHHPPLPGLCRPIAALEDAKRLKQVLVEEGAELVLHGHMHEHMLTPLATRFGTAHVLGVPSASVGNSRHHSPAAWNLYRITRQSGRWLTEVRTRSWRADRRAIETVSEFALST